MRPSLPFRGCAVRRNILACSHQPESAGELGLELELATPTPVDSVALFPLLTKGSVGEVAGFGFPRRFALEVFDEDDNGLLLMDETNRDFPRPGL